MKAWKTFVIGAGVFALGVVQIILTLEPVRLITIGVGLFFMLWGGIIGWTRYRWLTLLVGHLALTAGLLVTAWALYGIPFQTVPPKLWEVFDLPLFWGLFSAAGGFCMITHGYCRCAIGCHERNNERKAPPEA